MGRTFVDVEIQNFYDIALKETGQQPDQNIRTAEVHALVDTGSALLCLPKSVIDSLGLHPARTAQVRTANGIVDRLIYRAAQITMLDRQFVGEVMEIPEDLPSLVGYIALENLDLVVDPNSNRVIPNPESGGKYTLDLLLSYLVRCQ